jgi:hypothetical protein
MDIILPKKSKKAVYPVAIFKEGWSVCRKNLEQLSTIYLIFNVPFVIFYLTPLAGTFQGQKLNPGITLLLFLAIFIINFWGYIALLLGAKESVESSTCAVWGSIVKVKTYFFRYLGTALLSSLFLGCITIFGGALSYFALILLLKVNKIIALSACIFLAILTIAFLIYFMFRWSLATVACVLEECRPMAALKRSRALVNDYIHPLAGVFCLIMLVYLVFMIPAFILGAVFDLGKDSAQANQIGTIYNIIINIILAPFWTTITIVFYKKLKEALEINVHA